MKDYNVIKEINSIWKLRMKINTEKEIKNNNGMKVGHT